MTKTYCDRCEREISLDTKYTLDIKEHNSQRPAIRPYMLCAFCKVEMEGFLHERQ